MSVQSSLASTPNVPPWWPVAVTEAMRGLKISVESTSKPVHTNAWSTIVEGVQKESYQAKSRIIEKTKNIMVKVVNGREIMERNRANDWLNERQFRKSMRHRNIVHTLNIHEVVNFYPFIVMEKGQNTIIGIRHTYPEKKIPESQCKLWFSQICSAVEFMHSKGWAHCKITPWSIVIASPDRAFLVGFSHLSKNKEEKIQSIIFAFRSPQMILHPPGNPYDPFKADVWALGYSIFQITTNISFWPIAASTEDVKTKILRVPQTLETHKAAYPQLIDLVLQMMKIDDKERVTMKKVIKHNWLKNPHSASPYADPNRPTQNVGQEIREQFGPFTRRSQLLPNQMHAAGYRIDHVMGEGSFGAVYHGFKGRREVAVKILDVRKGSRNYRRKYFNREMEVVRNFKHPNMVEIIDVFEELEKSNKVRTKIEKNNVRRVFLTMEMCPSDLRKYIWSQPNHRLTEVQAMRVIMDVARGLEYMHRNHCAHRDLKPNNILVRANGQACLTDYTFVIPRITKLQEKLRILGEAKHRGNDEVYYGHRTETEMMGTYIYCCPQILKPHPHDYNAYKADIWALGIIIYECLTGRLPFTDTDLGYLVRESNVLKVRIHLGHFSDQAKNLMKKCLNYEEEGRIFINSVVNDEWFRYANNPEQLTYTTYKAVFLRTPPNNFGPNHFAIYMKPPQLWEPQDKDLYRSEIVELLPLHLRGGVMPILDEFTIPDPSTIPPIPFAGPPNWPTMVSRTPGVAPWQNRRTPPSRRRGSFDTAFPPLNAMPPVGKSSSAGPKGSAGPSGIAGPNGPAGPSSIAAPSSSAGPSGIVSPKSVAPKEHFPSGAKSNLSAGSGKKTASLDSFAKYNAFDSSSSD